MNTANDSVSNSQKWAIILPVILHLVIALPLAYVLNIWVDEASTIYTTKNGFFYALQNALEIEKQAPLYFWILSLWRSVNDSVFFARLFSIIFSVAAIFFFQRLIRLYLSEKSAIFATAFFALHPYLIWASLEIRLYSAVILLSILILKIFSQNFVFKDSIAKNSSGNFLLIAVSVIALYTNYYLGFLLFGCFVALLAAQKWNQAKEYFLRMLIVGLFLLPLLWAIKSQFAVNTSGFKTEKTVIEALQTLWNYFLSFVLPTEIFPPLESEISALSFFRLWLIRLLILAAVVFLIKTRKIFNKEILISGTICAVIAGFLLAAYFVLGGKYVAIRHAAVWFVPVILFVSIVIKQIPSHPFIRIPKISWILPAILIAASFSYALFMLYPNFAKRGDWARIATFIEATEKRNQPIIIFPNYDALALPVYYKGINQIFPDENFFVWELEAPAGTAESMKKQAEFVISEIPTGAEEIWLLTDHSCRMGQRCLPLENFVQANYIIVEEKDFYEEKVRLLRKNKND